MGDLDFHLPSAEQDPISKYFDNQLEILKIENNSLEEQLKRRKELLDQIKNDVRHDGVLQVQGTWTKTYSGNYLYGIELKNKSDRCLHNIHTILKFPAEVIAYSQKIYKRYSKEEMDQCEECRKVINHGSQARCEENALILTDGIKSEATVVLVINKPKFQRCLEMKIEGILKCSGNISIHLPEFKLSTRDFVDPRLELKYINLMQGIPQEVMSYFSVKKSLAFVIVSNNPSMSLEDLLEIYCNFRKIDVKFYGGVYFLVQDVLESINGIVVNLYHNRFTCYYKDHQQLENFLHFMFENVRDIKMLPLDLDESIREIGLAVFSSLE